MRDLTGREIEQVSGAGDYCCYPCCKCPEPEPPEKKKKGNNGWGNGKEGSNGPNGKFPEIASATGFKEEGNR